MKKRQVFSTPDVETARRAMAAAKAAGVADEDVSFVARSDIQMESIPDDRLDVSQDTVPAALRGAGAGGAIGLIGGLVAVAIPPIGITVAGAGLVALIAAAVGGWSAALAGSAAPNAVRQKFESEIEAGRVLVVVDVEDDREAELVAAVRGIGAVQLPFDEASALQ